MDSKDKIILEKIQAENLELYQSFFDKSQLVDRDLNSHTRTQLKALFQKHSHEDFDTFILRINKAMEQEYQNPFQKHSKSSSPIIIRLSANSTQETSNIAINALESSTQTTEPDPLFEKRCTSSQTIEQAVKNEKCKKTFDPLRFITYKMLNEDYTFLEFQSDNDTFDELLYCSKRYSVNRHFKKLTNQIELLNKLYKYRILEIYYS